MARFGWTEKQMREEFTTEGMELFLDYLGIRDRVLAARSQSARPGPRVTVQGNRLVVR
jgi:hypothetical protein